MPDPRTHATPRRPAPPRSMAGRGLLAGALAVLFVGCSGDSSAAQEAAVPSQPNVVVERADRARVKGDTAAPVQLVEVSDFQCPYCAQFYRETYPGIDSLYVQTGKVEYVWISLAAAGHPRAWPAIEAAFCAGAVGRFWAMHDRLFENQSEWSEAERPTRHFVRYAEEIGVEPESFRQCVRQDLPAPLQVRDLQQVTRAGIRGTPTFFIDGRPTIQGAVDLERFRAVLDSAVAAAGQGGG